MSARVARPAAGLHAAGICRSCQSREESSKVDPPPRRALPLPREQESRHRRRDRLRARRELGLGEIRDGVRHEEEPVVRERPTARPWPGR